MFTDIYTINQDEFGGPTKCLTKGQRENFLDNMMHELWHQNDPFFHQLNTKFFRMGNKYFGGYHRDMDEFTKYLTGRVFDEFSEQLDKLDCECAQK